MTEPRNPYSPPSASVADPAPELLASDGTLIPNGRRVPFGNGASWLMEAMRQFTARPGKWLLLLLVLFALLIGVSIVPFVNLVTGFFGAIISAGIVYAAHNQRRTGSFGVADLFIGFKRKTGPLLGVGAVMMSAVLILGITLGLTVGAAFAKTALLGTGAPSIADLDFRLLFLAIALYLLFALPIFAATYLAPALILLHDVPVGTAMKMSLIALFKNFLPGLLFGLCALLLLFVSMIPLGLGLLFSAPVLMITTYTIYRDIFVE